MSQYFKHYSEVHASAASRYDFSQRASGWYWITWSLLAANLVMFLRQLQQGDVQNVEVLYELGGLWPPDVQDGQYWRLVSANFLHANVPHLGMNMAGLLVLGPFIERILGWFKYALIYSASGLGATACIAYLPLWLKVDPEFTVGASGAIMGLVGAIAAITLWGWLVDRVSIAAKRFRTVMVIIGVQLAFDFSAENISVTGHLSGMVIGFFVTLIVILLFGFKEQSRRSFWPMS